MTPFGMLFAEGETPGTSELEIGLYIFILAGFLGYHVITRMPPLLHTPLMSATNAISGISLIGSLVIAGANYDPLSTALGFLAVCCSSTNVVGGFLITDRMLKMFKSERESSERGFLARWAVPLAGVAVLGVLFVIFLGSKHIQAKTVLTYLYIISAVLFILGLKGLSSPRWARQGMFLAEFGMVVAIVGRLFHEEIKPSEYWWIAIGLAIGTVIGGTMGLRIPMTAVPQRTALSHSLGALAAALVGVSEYIREIGHSDDRVRMTAVGFEVVIGSLTFTGSLMAAAKLQGLLPGAPITYKGQNVSNFILLGVLVVCLLTLIVAPSASFLFFLMVVLALAFGLSLVIPIGAADMPVVIALLNSYGGLADAAMGFALNNKIQIITGSLDGTSGFLLSLLMCRAMNRSAFNVLFGAFGKVEKETEAATDTDKGSVRSIAPEEMAVLFDDARSVIVV